jgi:hypothetical protein
MQIVKHPPRWLCALALAALAVPAWAIDVGAALPAQPVPDNQLSIGPRTLALPDGNWTYVAQAQWSVKRGPPPRLPVYAAYALDVQAGRVRAGVVLEMPTRSVAGADWDAETCKSHNPLFSDSFGSNWKEPECLQVFQRAGHLLGTQGEFYAQAQKWLLAQSVPAPGASYEVVYTKYGRNDYGRVRVFVPAQAVENDEEMIAWAKQLPDVLRGFMEKRSSEVKLPTIPARAVVAVAAEPAPAPPDPNDSTAGMVPYRASGYAKLEDVDALPYSAPHVQKAYREWLTKPLPRAFVLSSQKVIYSVGRDPDDASEPRDPSERALLRCRRASQTPCQLYAVDNVVVWVPPEAPAKAP